ncbi:MAG: ATP-binding cassette domain-containing protein [Bacteroidales bacterium]
MNNTIIIRNARANNLKNISLEIPHGKLVVVCGVSGSGKSSLIYDVIGKEGQRLFYEHFLPGSYHQNIKLGRPEADQIEGLPAVLMLNQQGNASSPRSTVGTITGLWDLLRLLFARYAHSDSVAEANRSLFSFNSPAGQCPQCKGLGVEDHIDPKLLIGDDTKTLREGASVLTTPNGYIIYSQVTMEELNKVCVAEGFSVDIPWKDLTDAQKNIVLNGSEKIKILFGKHTLESRLKWSGITAKPREEGFYKGIVPVMEEILKRDRNPNILRFARSFTCQSCSGTRLRDEALSFEWNNKSIDDFHRMSIEEIHQTFSGMTSENEGLMQISEQILKNTTTLLELGAGYLQLNRESSTLSTGELNRLRLAAYTTSGIRNILYILDEPGAGLHDSEQQSMMKVLRRLVDHGNSVIVVDHHEKNIAAADYIIEIGPGAGNDGGEVLFSGNASHYFSQNISNSPTQKWLHSIPELKSEKLSNSAFEIHQANKNNLKNISVSFVRSAFNVLCGVSGSGKTSLLSVVHDQATQAGFSKIIHIDADPFGRSPRSNPATYTGLSDVLRDLFASTAGAKENKLTKTHFSLAVPGGRCEDCMGAGLKQIGMHFLGNVEIPCETCGGMRFSETVLHIQIREKNMYDVLELSVAEAHEFFSAEPKVLKYTRPMLDLGLGYIKLGQSSTTLSGGEAQRVKLASELVRGTSGSVLFLLDEPATGLHPHDVNNLISALRELTQKGHTVIAAEHDLRMIAQADHICELGPGSGTHGGNLVFSGVPAELISNKNSKTAQALSEFAEPKPASEVSSQNLKSTFSNITLKQVHTNNLDIPEIQFHENVVNAVCGPSGSGKSSLVFDTLYAASQNALMDGLSFRIRSQLKKAGNATLDEYTGLMPAIALEKKSASGNPRSTVGTYTGLYDLYRLLYSRFSKNGEIACPHYSNAFSFNNEAGACPDCHGLGFITQCDAEKLVSDPSKPLIQGAIDGSKPGKFYGEPDGQYVAALLAVGKKHSIDFSVPYSELSTDARSIAMHGCGDETFDVEWNYKRGNVSGVHKMKSKWPGFCGHVEEEYHRVHNDHRAEQILPVMSDMTCPSCGGYRIHHERLQYKIDNRHIGETTDLCASEAISWFQHIQPGTGSENIVAEILQRLNYLIESGIGYIALSRMTATLSGGEFQRLRMSALLQSQLSGVMIVMDEPSFGLSKSDCSRISQLLKNIVQRGNTLVMTDHHPEMIQLADRIKVLGPGAGKQGGRLVKEVSSTEYISEIEQTYSKVTPLHSTSGAVLQVTGASANNLKNIDAAFSGETLNVITGNSGSGKTSLLQYVMYDSHMAGRPVKCRSISGFENFDSVVFIQQDVPSGSAASIPATWLGLYDTLKNIFAAEAARLKLPLKATDFSVFSKEGRCPECGGTGVIKTSMDFRSDSETVCESCNGARFRSDILNVVVDGISISDVLNMSISEAAEFVQKNTTAAKAASFLTIADLCTRCGVDYISPGQNLSTLSTGELQRLKLIQGIASAKGKTLFLLDEPSGGLHPTDTLRLLHLFEHLVKQGHTIICATHDEMIRRAAANNLELQ